MPPTNPFPHIPLVMRFTGPARPPRGGGDPPTATLAARSDRAAHSSGLNQSASGVVDAIRIRLDQRAQVGAPPLPKGVPLLLEIDPSLDLDGLARMCGFEIVSEQEDGFVIVASNDLDLADFLTKLNDFIGNARGSANVAKIHNLLDDPRRIERILTPELLARWPFSDDLDYTCDVGVECEGTVRLPKPVTPRKRERPATWARRQLENTNERNAAFMAWDQLKDERYDAVQQLIVFYGGEMLDGGVHTPHSSDRLTGEFTVRVRVNGKGLTDLVQTFPFLYEVTEPDEIELPQRSRDALARARDSVRLAPPAPGDPAVCVIDSGMQEGHYLLEPAVDTESSRCFLPGVPSDRVADLVRPGGHGTRVAGAVLYGDDIPTSGSRQLDLWLQNARVLDDQCHLPDRLFPPAALREIVHTYHNGKRRTRIFSHSINAVSACRSRHMSAWAAEIDELSTANDILFILSAGNLPVSRSAPQLGILEHLANGHAYPQYLCEDGCRVANPAQSLHALTVGSVAYGPYTNGDWRAFAEVAEYPSAFSRSGLGIWGTIKPDVVEFGGDNVRSDAHPAGVMLLEGDACPNLVRSTVYPPGPAFARDDVGTSYAAPKVARIAASLQRALPDSSCLLYRALIVQSARWPQWARAAPAGEQSQIIRWIGYGVPNAERATGNSDHRFTLISGDDRAIKARECHLYQIPIPAEMRKPGDDFEILVEVTMTYTATPRRTRRNPRHYLSTWVDWKSSRVGETLERFRTRAIKTDGVIEAEGTPVGWMLEAHADHGTVRGVKRSSGSAQKDWTVVASNRLPKDFCIAVIGHQGWDDDPEATARYALTVSFEILGREIPIYNPLRVAVEELRSEVEVEVVEEIEASV